MVETLLTYGTDGEWRRWRHRHVHRICSFAVEYYCQVLMCEKRKQEIKKERIGSKRTELITIFSVCTCTVYVIVRKNL